MDGDGDDGPNRGRGEMNSFETGGADGNIDIGAGGDPDEDAATGTLRSMGYIDGESEVGGGGSTGADSGDSVLQTVAILAIVAVLALSVGYVLLEIVLGIFGVTL
ncbi:hypothetical protein [Halosimplex halophilum]|uniref:hypothetical protein n=1 Tax=Halosimplex halophilum TaxID=2559572 RepID=UPI00107FCF6E|nr:hypothetical protein [Halosimplex halophilum]